MRTQTEIDEAIGIFCEAERSTDVEIVLNVLENDLDDMEIENLYFDENDPWGPEYKALQARQFMDGEIDLEELKDII